MILSLYRNFLLFVIKCIELIEAGDRLLTPGLYRISARLPEVQKVWFGCQLATGQNSQIVALFPHCASSEAFNRENKWTLVLQSINNMTNTTEVMRTTMVSMLKELKKSG